MFTFAAFAPDFEIRSVFISHSPSRATGTRPDWTAAMVLFFTPRGNDETKHYIYMGRDKVENEDLSECPAPPSPPAAAALVGGSETLTARSPPLRSASPLAVKWGLPEDVWFHVDKMSSAHVYMRVKKGQTWDDLTEEELEDCAQLVKANSIQGNKENNVWIVYTPWANLKKLPRMEVGQVGYHDLKLVRRIKVEKRQNEIVNRLNKTKCEEYPDLAAEREAYDSEVREEKKRAFREAENARLEEERAREADREARDYKHIMDGDKMVTNKDIAAKYESVSDYEDDFM